MTVIIGAAIFIVGVLIGFITNKLMNSTSQENQELTNKLEQGEQNLEQYKANVAEHLESSAQLLEQMHSTCKDAMEQMAQSTKLLQEATPEDSTSMPFFSQETQEHIAQTVQLRSSSRTKQDIKITEAPLDYSGNPSGLFKDTTQTVTNADSEKKELN